MFFQLSVGLTALVQRFCYSQAKQTFRWVAKALPATNAAPKPRLLMAKNNSFIHILQNEENYSCAQNISGWRGKKQKNHLEMNDPQLACFHFFMVSTNHRKSFFSSFLGNIISSPRKSFYWRLERTSLGCFF